jgi:hypothetical protein
MEKLEIIKKAWRVYYDGMLSIDFNMGYTDIDEIPVVYAESANKAKVNRGESFYYDLPNGYPASYLDLKVKRAKGMDIVKFKDVEYKRWEIKEMEKKDEIIKERKEWLDKFSDNSLFYIQNGYVGNSVLWWAKDSKGYTTNIEDAHKFTKKEIQKSFIESKREEDRIWFVEHVEKHIKKHVDGQYLSNEFCLF